MTSITFDLVTPEKLLFSQDAAMVVVPGVEGDFGVLQNHAPLISTLRPGVVEIYEDEGAKPHKIFVTGGVAEVTGERCTVLAEETVDLDALDKTSIDARLAKARKQMEVAEEGEIGVADAAVAIAEALAEAFHHHK